MKREKLKSMASSGLEPRHSAIDRLTKDLEGSRYEKIPVDAIDSNPWQPRRRFDESRIEELAKSIAENEQIEPIIVRPKSDRYELVAGERRLLAHKNLGRARIEAVIRHISDGQMAVLALAENMDREDLTDYEIGIAMSRAVHDFKFKKGLADMLGISHSDFYRYMSFLDLPEWVREKLDETPDLLSKRAAEDLKAFLKDKNADEYREATLAAMSKLSQKELDNKRLIAYIEKQHVGCKRVVSSTVISTLKRNGRNIGKLKVDYSGKLTLRLNDISEDELKQIEEFLRSMLSANSSTEGE